MAVAVASPVAEPESGVVVVASAARAPVAVASVVEALDVAWEYLVVALDTDLAAVVDAPALAAVPAGNTVGNGNNTTVHTVVHRPIDLNT